MYEKIFEYIIISVSSWFQKVVYIITRHFSGFFFFRSYIFVLHNGYAKGKFVFCQDIYLPVSNDVIVYVV